MVDTIKNRILVVDDEVELLTALCEILNEKGYEALGFSSCKDAFTALIEQDVDILLVDLMMPEMDGIEFLSEAQKIDPNVIGILMTGYGTVHTAVEAMKVGACDYVLKPFKINMLLTVLNRALEMRRLRNENLQLRETMAIYDLSTAVSSTFEMPVILNKIADTVLKQCEADEMSIMLPTNSGNEFYVAVVRGERNENILGECIPIQDGIAGWVASNQQELLMDGEVHDPRFSPIRPRPEIKSSLSMPLLAGGKCIGVLNVNSLKRKSFFHKKFKALKILACTAAIALENAQLYAELRESEARYRQIVETATEGIWVVDGACRTTFVNKWMAKMLAYTVEEIIGKSFFDFIDDDWIAAAKNIVNHRIQGISEQHEFMFRRKDGKELWVILSDNPSFESNGQYLGSVSMVTDITKRKQLEQEMVRLDRLNLIGQMAAGIGHEIRNPMTSVRGFLQILGRKEEFAKNKTYFDLMIDELDRVNYIITEFISLARIKVLDKKRINLNAIIEALLPLIQADAIKNERYLKVELGEIPDLLLDEKEIRQIILNFVRNGLEASPPGSDLTIRSFIEGDHVVLAVQDKGEGIKPDVLEKIGTPFFTTKENGTGLGLAVCYSIAARHNAKIEIKTNVGGTTFFVQFKKFDNQ
ncbi:PAS domain S-box protein [Desulfotomaculum sp. 1211_IL3151]|uniref:PAS domain S-box protein n=1 Tax=Desulfotomaculum sp. 1211_IL3151 TaxID=3084055 RepID=UPI002FD9FD04